MKDEIAIRRKLNHVIELFNKFNKPEDGIFNSQLIGARAVLFWILHDDYPEPYHPKYWSDKNGKS